MGLLNSHLYLTYQSHAPGPVDVSSGNNTVTFIQYGQTHTVIGFLAKPPHDLVTGVGPLDAARFVTELSRRLAALGKNAILLATHTTGRGPSTWMVDKRTGVRASADSRSAWQWRGHRVCGRAAVDVLDSIPEGIVYVQPAARGLLPND